MPRGRHREEPVRRSFPRLPRQFARPIAVGGVVAALLGVTSVITLWPGGGSGPATRAVAAADDGRRDAAMATDALQAAAALRAEDRASRNGTRWPYAATPADAGRTPAVVRRLWVKSDVNVRSGPSTGTHRIAGLKAGTRVGVTGVTRSGWTQVVNGGRAGWVRSSYLSRTKPRPQSSPAGVSGAPCSISPSIESHLTSHARSVYRAVCAAFGGSVSSFGGYRPGDSGDHGSGRAVDIMVSGDPGWSIARYVQAHARQLDVTYVIFQQQIWLAGHPTGEWKAMEDRGSRTANHYDHVHVSVS